VVEFQPASSRRQDGVAAVPEASPFVRRGLAAMSAIMLCSAVSAAALLFVAYELHRSLNGTSAGAVGTLQAPRALWTTPQPLWTLQIFAIGGLLAAAAGGAALCLAMLLRRQGVLAAESQRYFQLLFDRSPAAIYRTAADGRLLDCNPAFLRLLGHDSPAELMRAGPVSLYFDPAERAAFLGRLREAGQIDSAETCLRRRDGRPLWVLESVAWRPARNGDAVSVEGALIDITGRKAAEGQIAHQAYHDQLTGLPNRPLFLDRLAQSLAKARRTHTGVAVLALDIDRLRVINETRGQAVGDQLLQGVAERLRAMVRKGDTAARFGADEFTLLLQFDVGADEAAKVAQKIVEDIGKPFSFGGEPVHATVSIGVGLHPADGEDAEALLRSSDRALLRAREMGGNGYQLCTPAMNARAVARLALESDLRRAVERHELELLYQPVVSFSSGLTVGMEALVRWQHPQRGLVPPAQFIPLAEELRLVVPIGEWVLATACRQARDWHAGVLPGVRMAINLSALHFQDADLPRSVAALLREVDLDPDFLDLEITESAAMQNIEQTIVTLGALRRLGVHIAMDDFGTGQASLGYLKRLPIDCLKIDRGFVRDLDGSNGRAGEAIVTAILDMAHGLGLKVIAEGVETEQQYRFLDRRGCDEYQGYLVSRPVKAAEIELQIGRGRLQRQPS
jgi:diguanylate cyclase (GGDEF)-like protein/PAS domain S-box-containing protein